MKRFISFICIVLMLTTSLAINTYASGEITIISPSTEAYTDLSEIEVSCDNAEKIIFELDGEKIGETNGECIFTLPNALAVGNHSLKTIAVFGDKSAAQDYIEFNVKNKIIKGSTQDFNTYTGGDKADGIKHVGQSGKSSATSVPGKSGAEGDKALYMKMETNDAITSGNPYIDVTLLENYGLGTANFKYDIKIDDPKTARISWSYVPLWAKGNYVFYDGKITNTETDTPSGWTSVNMTVNYKTRKVSLILDDDVVLSDASWGEGEESSSNNRIRIGLYQYGKRKDSTRTGFTIDNMDFSQEIIYGLEKIQYSSDESDSWIDYSSELPLETNAIKLTLSENLTPEDVSADTVKLLQNGSEVSLDSVEYDSETCSIIVRPSNPLESGAQLVLKVDDAVRFADKTQTGTGAVVEARMNTEKSAFTPDAFVLKNNGNSLLSASQLKEGDVISADVTLQNDSDSEKAISAFVVVRQNGKLRSLGAAQTSMLSAGLSETVNITLPAIAALDSEGDVSVKLIICSELTDTVPYVSFIELK